MSLLLLLAPLAPPLAAGLFAWRLATVLGQPTWVAANDNLPRHTARLILLP